ncbi:hypothetical protein [Morganella morganii]|uniref:hypothetical protein n=1 Tax=Morganella morganii TaxID=582 RepID=UPI0032DA652F
MKKIGDVTSTADKNGEWTNGNVAAGIAPTILEAGWLNSVQREILGVLVEAGIAQDKNNDNQLKDAIKKIISNWNYATPEDLKKYLAKDQNGADIPNKDTFIKNLGLEERLNKKFDKTGGTISGPVEIKAAGRALKMTAPTENAANYIELFGADKRLAYVGFGSEASPSFTISNEKTGIVVRISDDVTINGYRALTIADTQIPVGGSVIWNSTAPIPDNFWPNEGRSFSATDYPELTKVFPSLKLPDDRGYAIRIADNGRDIDSGRKVGTFQEDAIRNFTGWFGERDFRSPNTGDYYSFLWGQTGVFTREKRISSEGASPVMEKASAGNWSGTKFDPSLVVPTANENRMKNVAKILITRVK